MKVSKLLLGAVLVIAIGAPIAGFVGDIKLPRSSIPTGEPIAFFHGLGSTSKLLPIGPLSSLRKIMSAMNAPRALLPLAGPPAIRLTRMRYRDDYRQTIGRYPAIGR